MTYARAIDISNYTGAPIAEQFRTARIDGNYRRVIVGTQDEAICRGQVMAAVAAGLETEAYVYLRFDRDPAQQVEAALAVLAGLPAGRLWLDCEDDTASALTEQETIYFIANAYTACRLPSGIYTRRDWWERQTGDTHDFAGLPLWNATNDGAGDLSFPQPYGGWTAVAMEQFAFDRDVAGFNADLNVYLVEVSDGGPVSALPAPTETGPPPDLSHQQLEVAAALAIRGLFGARLSWLGRRDSGLVYELYIPEPLPKAVADTL